MGPRKRKSRTPSSGSAGASNVPKRRKRVMQSDTSVDHNDPAPATQVVQQDKEEPATQVVQQDKEEPVYVEQDAEEGTLPGYLALPPMDPIPSGPAFQADLPDVTEMLDLQAYRNLTEGSKWLGTRVYYPIEDDADNADIGRGRPDTNCSCRVPGSERCVKHHVNEKRAQLRDQLGPVFDAWGFDQMGEVVSMSWVGNREHDFEKLVSTKRFLNPGTPLEINKSYKEMISYYFNVLVLRRVRAQARRGGPVDSDDDTHVDKRRKTKVSERVAASARFLKPRNRA